MAKSRTIIVLGYWREHRKMIARVAMYAGAVLIAIWLSLAMGLAPENHILNKASGASAKEVVAFEATTMVISQG